MPANSNLQKQIAQKVGLCLLIGVLLWVALLVAGAVHFRSAVDATTYTVGLGPLHLNEITRSATAGGQSVSFSFEAGLLWYFLIWVVLGVALGCIGSRHSTTKSNTID